MSTSSSLFEAAAREHANSRGAKGTRALYNADLATWLKWCEDNDHDPTAPTLAGASAFKDELESGTATKNPQKPLTIRRTLASLAAMYGHVVGQEKPLATWNPFKSVPKPSADEFAQTEAVSDEDAEKIISAAEKDTSAFGWRDAALMRLMYETGLRRKSVASLRREDVFKRGEQMIARIIVKGGRRQEVVLTDAASTTIENWLKRAPQSAYVFPALRGAKPLAPSAVNKIVDARAKQAGVVGVHPHSFRAAFATTALNSGMALHEVQAAMHHRDPKTTLRYDRGIRGTGVTNAVAEYRKGKK